MALMLLRWSSVKGIADVVSSILNWVCPECGGRMGGRGREFKCQGVCQTDWRQIWERGLSFVSCRLSARLDSNSL
jgi:tRNA(Ile2) C34 agmatinyltransferase TiaS